MAFSRKSIPFEVAAQALVQSNAQSNRELAEAFERYPVSLVARGGAQPEAVTRTGLRV